MKSEKYFLAFRTFELCLVAKTKLREFIIYKFPVANLTDENFDLIKSIAKDNKVALLNIKHENDTIRLFAESKIYEFPDDIIDAENIKQHFNDGVHHASQLL